MAETKSEGEKKKVKFCPFSYALPEGNYLVDCNNDCAWFDEECGRCVLVKLASALETLNLRLEAVGAVVDEPDEVEREARERRRIRMEGRTNV